MITLRPVSADDRDRVLAYNGAPDVRDRSIDPRPIAPADHARWFAARLADRLTRMWIVEADGAPVGVVRIERAGADDPTGRIAIALAAEARGHGVGRAAIAAACVADGGPVIADIQPDNHASRACFAAVGFAPCAEPGADAPTARTVRYLWRRA